MKRTNILLGTVSKVKILIYGLLHQRREKLDGHRMPMIKWFSKLPLLKKIYRQGGIDSFALAQKDILETMADDLEKQAEKLSRKHMNDLLSPIDWNSVMTLNKGQGILYVGGEIVDKGRAANLRSEAEFLLSSDLWKVLYESPKELAHKAMFVTGETLVDLQKGRAILYHLQAQKNILDILKQIKK